MTSSEKRNEKHLCAEVKRRGGLCLKLSAAFFTGLPDRLCILPGGHVFFVEVKGEGLKLSPRQNLVANKLWALGVSVYKVDSFETVDLILRYYDY